MMIRRYWDTQVTKTAKRNSKCDYRTFAAAVGAFEQLAYEESPVLRHDVQSIVCTGGRLFRQRASRPLYLLHYRNVFAIVRQERADGRRGTLLLLAVLERGPDTYNPAALNKLVTDVIAEVKREDTVKA